MPIYEFICQNCHSEFEKLVSFSNKNPIICPNCQGTDVERQMGLPAIHFKGSGWYITDSKSTNTSSQPAETNGSSSDSGDDGKSKSETTTESKSESSDGGTGSSKTESSNKVESSSSANTDGGAKKSTAS